MRPLTLYALSLLGVTAAAFPTSINPTHSDVVSLTQESFSDFIEGHDLVLVNFYAPWCYYSKELAPRFEQAATVLKADNIPLAKVDCTLERGLCSDYGIRGYPTLKVFRGLESVERYPGSRRTEWIVSHMRKELAFSQAGEGLYLQTYD
ncbi:hypothetical protein N7494_001179 [Penicillium frequentans]|uniref:protein disulfide-isomerase n=1 Tax=Penicillium frequentans TaxID=3151616 RepID=A0AAD6D7L3_9EURO|nr:hypothetical protein N7494_001179 [Penicillium glabrum]